MDDEQRIAATKPRPEPSALIGWNTDLDACAALGLRAVTA